MIAKRSFGKGDGSSLTFSKKVYIALLRRRSSNFSKNIARGATAAFLMSLLASCGGGGGGSAPLALSSLPTNSNNNNNNNNNGGGQVSAASFRTGEYYTKYDNLSNVNYAGQSATVSNGNFLDSIKAADGYALIANASAKNSAIKQGGEGIKIATTDAFTANSQINSIGGFNAMSGKADSVRYNYAENIIPCATGNSCITNANNNAQYAAATAYAANKYVQSDYGSIVDFLSNDPSSSNYGEMSSGAVNIYGTFGHGLALASIIAGSKDGNANGGNMHGVAFNSQLASIRAYHDLGFGLNDSSIITGVVDYARRNSIKVLKLSNTMNYRVLADNDAKLAPVKDGGLSGTTFSSVSRSVNEEMFNNRYVSTTFYERIKTEMKSAIDGGIVMITGTGDNGNGLYQRRNADGSLALSGSGYSQSIGLSDVAYGIDSVIGASRATFTNYTGASSAKSSVAAIAEDLNQPVARDILANTNDKSKGRLVTVAGLSSNGNIASWSDACGSSSNCLSAVGDNLSYSSNTGFGSSSANAISQLGEKYNSNGQRAQFFSNSIDSSIQFVTRQTVSGTSVAAAVVTGAYATIAAAMPGISVGEVVNRMLTTATPRYAFAVKPAALDEKFVDNGALTKKTLSSGFDSNSNLTFGTETSESVTRVEDTSCVTVTNGRCFDAQGNVQLSKIYGWGVLNLEAALSPIGIVSLPSASSSSVYDAAAPSFTVDASLMSFPASLGDISSNVASALNGAVGFDSLGAPFAVNLASNVRVVDNGMSSAANIINMNNFDSATFDSRSSAGLSSFGSLGFSLMIDKNYAQTARNFEKFMVPQAASAFQKSMYSRNFSITDNYDPTNISNQINFGNVNYMFETKGGTGVAFGLNQNANGVNFARKESLSLVNDVNFINMSSFRDPYINFSNSAMTTAQVEQNIGNFAFSASALTTGDIGFANSNTFNYSQNVSGSMFGNNTNLFNAQDKNQSFVSRATYRSKNSREFFSIGFGQNTESRNVFGVSAAGAMQFGSGGRTKFLTANAQKKIFGNVYLVASYSEGSTAAAGSQYGLISGVSNIRSRSYSVGLVANDILAGRDKLGVVYSEPVKVVGGSLDVNIATGRNEDGSINRRTSSVSLVSSYTEKNFEAFYSKGLSEGTAVTFNALLRVNPNHTGANSQQVYAVGIQHKFKN